MLRVAVPVLFCILVFFFALHAKTAVYGAAAQSRVTPSTASKLWVSGQKMEARIIPPQSAPVLFWLAFLGLLGLLLVGQRRLQTAVVISPPSNLRIRHLHRFLRPPPIQS